MISGRWVSPARNQNLPPSSDCVTDCKNSLRYPRGADGLSVTAAAKGNVYVLTGPVCEPSIAESPSIGTGKVCVPK